MRAPGVQYDWLTKCTQKLPRCFETQTFLIFWKACPYFIFFVFLPKKDYNMSINRIFAASRSALQNQKANAALIKSAMKPMAVKGKQHEMSFI
jgi:hypothetical protein